MSRYLLIINLLLLLVPVQILVYCQSSGNAFPARDKLGRKLPEYHEVGPIQKDKKVALFYWTWHVGHSSHNKAYDLSKIINDNQEMVNDFYHPMWDPYTDQNTFFWAEPVFGYYNGKDKWVIRKQLEMFADAGIDVLIYDASNGDFLWEEGYVAVAEVMEEAIADGVSVPQFAFLLNFGALETTVTALVKLYDNLYQPERFLESWFIRDGKPLIMAYPEALDLYGGNDTVKDKYQTIKQFFTFKPAWPVYNVGPQRPDHWGWLQIYPQHGFGVDGSGKIEFMTVGVAQNWSDDLGGLTAMNAGKTVRGRSFTAANQFDILNEESYLYGFNFQEQWDRVLKLDPEIVFITGWNEWVAGRFEQWPIVSSPIPGVGEPVDNAFPDQFSLEYSRDIEPMVGGYGDNYYYQMINNIRRFKGMPEPQIASNVKTIAIDGYFEDWVDVYPDYIASKGNIGAREGYGYIDPESPTEAYIQYVNQTGRNDLIRAKAARDENFVYFFIETDDDITCYTDEKWMRLFIDVDRCKSTGWEGYDIALNIESPEKNYSKLAQYTNGWNWVTMNDSISYEISGEMMEIALPRRYFKEPLDFEFKWSDNMQVDGDIYDFLLHGDVAPSGRFNYRFGDIVDGIIQEKDHLWEKVRVNPNPVDDQVNIIIDLKNNFDELDNWYLSIYNTFGQLLYSQNLDQTRAEFIIKVNASEFQSGIYIVSVYSEKIKFRTTKFLKK
jgi:hypothetical protein